MTRLIDVDAFRREFGFSEECRDCKRIAKWKCDSQMYSARDICGWLDDTPIVTNWISVKDRSPKTGEVYLITLNPPGAPPQTMEAYLSSFGDWWHGSAKLKNECVTHWMPLPDPAKEANGDD